MNDRFRDNLNPAELTAFRAVVDWRLAASTIVTGNGTNWGGSGPSGSVMQAPVVPSG